MCLKGCVRCVYICVNKDAPENRQQHTHWLKTLQSGFDKNASNSISNQNKQNKTRKNVLHFAIFRVLFTLFSDFDIELLCVCVRSRCFSIFDIISVLRTCFCVRRCCFLLACVAFSNFVFSLTPDSALVLNFYVSFVISFVRFDPSYASFNV